MFGIVSTGPSSLAIDLTYDLKRLDEAIKKISGAGLKPNDILRASESADGPSEVRYRAHVAFSTAYDLMKNLEQVHNRRKALDLRQRRLRLQPVRQPSRQKARADDAAERGTEPGRAVGRTTRPSCGAARGSSSPTRTWRASWRT